MTEDEIRKEISLHMKALIGLLDTLSEPYPARRGALILSLKSLAGLIRALPATPVPSGVANDPFESEWVEIL